MAPVQVCALADLPEGTPRVFRVGERELALVRWRDGVYALRNVCPHMSSSFEGGSAIPTIAGTVGNVELDPTDPVLTCPWHQYEFGLKDGRCRSDRALRVRTYRVDVVDGQVAVDLSRPARRPREPRLQSG
jgi:nitrite reductase/ring-hydroxylating ferredoxin subunit